jgi:hypothetical protein
MTEQQRNALFVRLTPEQARRLERAAEALPARYGSWPAAARRAAR